MNRYTIGLMLAIVLLLSAPGAVLANSAAPSLDSCLRPMQIIALATDKADVKGIGYYTDGYCFLGAFMDPGTAHGTTLSLKAGTQYLFAGACRDDAANLSIVVEDSNGTEVARKDANEDYVVKAYTPTEAGSYTVRLSLTKGKASTICYLATLQQDGIKISADEVAEADESFASDVDDWADIFGQSMSVSSDTSSWVVMGAALSEGESLSMGGISLPSKERLLLAAGSGSLTTISLELRDAAGKGLEHDYNSALTADILYATKTGDTYKLQTTVDKATGTSMVITGVLDFH